ncbi:MAG TPA: IS110 family transposase [Mycobacteriales bacterium]|nr:IS110 family transposase [Mycobacteriales bacterium]
MSIVGGLDLHRQQVTFDWINTDSGEAGHGRICPVNRETFRRWLHRFDGNDVELVVEGCTGWRFIVEECQAAGAAVHLADPAEAADKSRSPKRRAKTDKIDAKHLRQLAERGDVPDSWIPPFQVLEVRTKVRLYRDLVDECASWQHRCHATLYHAGASKQERLLLGDPARLTESTALSPAGRQAIEVALVMIDALDGQARRLREELIAFAKRQPGCVELTKEFGVGPLTAAILWEELGDTRRFSSSSDAVRHSGLDVSIYSSDGKRTRARLTRQGQPLLRWAVFEAARHACKPSSPDHAYYLAVAERLGKKRAALSVARKLTRRCHHRLRALGDEAFAPVTV